MQWSGEHLQLAQCGTLKSIPEEALAENREPGGGHPQKQEGSSSDRSVLGNALQGEV